MTKTKKVTMNEKIYNELFYYFKNDLSNDILSIEAYAVLCNMDNGTVMSIGESLYSRSNYKFSMTIPMAIKELKKEIKQAIIKINHKV